MKTRVRKLDGSRKPESLAQNGWIWGIHAVNAAVSNNRRRIHRLLVTANGRARLTVCPEHAETVDTKTLSRHVPAQAVHQGVALLAEPLPMGDFGEICANGGGPIIILDQVSDPHNVGAVFRSGAAFGAEAIIMQTRHAPALSGALTKAAAGGVEVVEQVRVTNIARSLGLLDSEGWCVIGLDGRAETLLSAAVAPGSGAGRYALVFGAEGKGLRPLVARACTCLARIPMPGSSIENLNISNAAAITLYQLAIKA